MSTTLVGSSNHNRFLPKADTFGLRCLGRISERRLRWVVWLRPPLPHHPGGKVGAGDGTARRMTSARLARAKTTARARISRLSAVLAATPQGQFLPCLSSH